MPPKNVKIVLTVDVTNICALTNPTESEIEKYCHLSDDNNGSGKNVKDFGSQVYGRKKVEWKVKAQDGGKVKLIMISINPNSPVIFEEGYILMPDNNGKITGHIRSEKTLNLVESHYSIFFEVSKQGNNCGSHRIDPKLKANTII